MQIHRATESGYRGLGRLVLAAVLTFLACLPAGWAQEEKQPARENTKAERERAARELGANDFAVREEATGFLWQCGLAARPLLEQVAASGDLEASERAKGILKRFDRGDCGKLPPDRPGKLAVLALDAAASPERAVAELLDEEPTEAELRGFLLAIPTVEVRRRAVAALSSDANYLLWLSLRRGPEAAEGLLKIAAGSGDPDAVRRWTAYLVVAGRVEEALADLVKEETSGKLPEYKLPLLSALHYAAGHYEKALELAERIDYYDVKLSMAARREDWLALGELVAETVTNYRTGAVVRYREARKTARESVSGLAVRARAARLAGRDDAADKLLGEVLAKGPAVPLQQGDYCWNLLFIENRFDDVLRLMANDDIHPVLLAMRPDERSDQAVGGPAGPLPAFPDSADNQEATSKTKQQNDLQNEFDTIRRNSAPGDPRLAVTIRQEQRKGFHDLALRHAAEFVSACRATGANDEDRIRLAVSSAFSLGAPAYRLFVAVEAARPNASVLDNMQQVSKLLHYDSSLALVRELLAQGSASPLRPGKMSEADWSLLLAQVCWSRGLDKEAVGVLAGCSGASLPWLDVACEMLPYLPKEQRIPLARAAARDTLRQGNRASFCQAVEVLAACDFLAPDEDSTTRELCPILATSNAGHKAYAIPSPPILELLVGSAASAGAVALRRYEQIPGAWGTGRMADVFVAARRFAEALRESRIDELWLVREPCSLDPDAGNPHASEHRLTRIKLLLACGKREEAEQMVRLPAVWSMDPDHAIALHKTLAEAGLKREAAYVFRTAYRVSCSKAQLGLYELDVELNNLAWLCGCCGEELGKARQWAERAVRLDPNNACYLDTLARVLAAQGELDKAIVVQRRCVALNPRWVIYEYRESLYEYIRLKTKRDAAGAPEAAKP